MNSRHQGQFWIGGYERRGDEARGTLTSVPFKVTHPFASFLVGGGPQPETRVELVRADTRRGRLPAPRATTTEDMKRVVVDLTPHLGQKIFIRLVDDHSGGWGHVNFDDFRFHDARPDVPPAPQRRAARRLSPTRASTPRRPRRR